MKFLDSDLQDYTGTGFNVYKDDQGDTIMKFQNGDWIKNELVYADVFLGKCVSCSRFYKDSFTNFTYDSVLIAGLGFGLLPQELSAVNGCSKIDVVEISQEVIDYNVSSNHLNSDINVILGNIYNYTTSDQYDLIIIDTIWHEHEMTEIQYQTLVAKFVGPNLNVGGALYVPVLNKFQVK